MTETDTEFLSRMLAQSSMPQGQAAHPDVTRLLALAAEAGRLKEALREAGEMLAWVARRMNDAYCSSKDVAAMNLAAGKTAAAYRSKRHE